MKEFLSNSWVVSIISGIIVFFFTNTVIMLQNRRKHKKQINDANNMMLNRLRRYVVDNDLPQKEIINAVKSSTAREYGVKYNELLSIKEFCEELITDIIGNTYISNDNKAKYLNMLHNYLKENTISHDYNLENNASKNIEIEISKSNYFKKRNKVVSFIDLTVPLITAIFTIVGVFISFNNITNIELSKFEIYSVFIVAISIIMILVITISFLPILSNINKRTRKKIKRITKRK